MPSVNQFVHDPKSGNHVFEHLTDGDIEITGAPGDANFRRWSMLHDGEDYRLYVFKDRSRDTIYQFAWDGDAYSYGHNNSIAEIKLIGVPEDADAGSFSVVHSGDDYHLYLRRLGNPHLLYQFLWSSSSEAYKYDGDEPLVIDGFPADTDWSRWGMLHDGKHFRFLAFQLGSRDRLYQGAWDGSVYKFGHESQEGMEIHGIPANSDIAGIAMLHDDEGVDRLYFQTLAEGAFGTGPFSEPQQRGFGQAKETMSKVAQGGFNVGSKLSLES